MWNQNFNHLPAFKVKFTKIISQMNIPASNSNKSIKSQIINYHLISDFLNPSRIDKIHTFLRFFLGNKLI